MFVWGDHVARSSTVAVRRQHMSTDDTDPKLLEGFHRQRRSVLAVSLALLAFQGLDAQLTTFSLFGNSIELDAPLQIATPLWIAWGYFCIRYYQYLRD